jgi:hypothetical protein
MSILGLFAGDRDGAEGRVAVASFRDPVLRPYLVIVQVRFRDHGSMSISGSHRSILATVTASTLASGRSVLRDGTHGHVTPSSNVQVPAPCQPVGEKHSAKVSHVGPLAAWPTPPPMHGCPSAMTAGHM